MRESSEMSRDSATTDLSHLKCVSSLMSTIRGTDSSTLVAVPAQQDFRHFTNLIAHRLALPSQLDLMQAGDCSTIDANKMRMMCVWMFTFGKKLKPPNVVPQFRATRQSDRYEVCLLYTSDAADE